MSLSSKHWETAGSTGWQTLAGLWVCAKVGLGKSGYTNLSFKEIHQSAIPPQWKDWMCAKLMKTDIAPPFGNIEWLESFEYHYYPGTAEDPYSNVEGLSGMEGMLLNLPTMVELKKKYKACAGVHELDRKSVV